MGLIQTTVVTTSGVSCDMPGCASKIHYAPVTGYAFQEAVRALEQAAMEEGWSRRYVRSVRWYCPDHESNAYRCTQRYCLDEPHDVTHPRCRTRGGAEGRAHRTTKHEVSGSVASA